MVAGLLLVLVHIFEDSHTMSDMEALLTWILLAALGWLVLWFVFVALMRWTLGSVIVPTLVNAVLVTGVTVLILRTYDLWEWAWVIGSLVGLIIGALLCLFYSRVVAR